MSVELVPSSQLGFHRPLTTLVKRTLTVANPNSQPIAFKVKTTAPKAFCVRPNSGRIEPGERVEVQVLLQPMKEEPAMGAKCRDKFLIQSAVITVDRETQGLAELWAKVEAEHKSGVEGVIHEQKIRCAFLPPVDAETGSTPANDSSFVGGSGFTNGVSTPSASRFDTVKSGQEGTPYHAATAGPNGDSNTTGSTFSPPPYDTSSAAEPSSPSPASGGAPLAEKSAGVAGSAQAAAQSVVASLPKSTEEVKQVASNAATSISNAASSAAASAGLTSASTSTSGTRSMASVSGDNASALQQELQTAKAEIERIKKLLAQKEEELASGLRQRNVGGSGSASKDIGSSGSQTMVASTTQNGIPIEMVAAIAAGVFVFTWLFF